MLEMLNDDPEVAFIVADGVGRWKAVETISALSGERHAFWHVASGPLPLLAAAHDSPDSEVEDPWQGWAERRAGADPNTPYFGAGHPGIFWLNLKNRSHANEQTIGLSSFEWIGHRYAKLGKVVEPSTDKWWKRLGATIRRSSSKVPRGGPKGSFKPEIYALPGAACAFAEGKGADDNP
uniref:Uncharacterized protein n=1 Tax=Phenylobacterium glaciei TaxID=2803784 RepID=A0A974S805_9CAUL|nr:hypothetical protein JKL49_18915 [Phenylobacterium glaciei]